MLVHLTLGGFFWALLVGLRCAQKFALCARSVHAVQRTVHTSVHNVVLHVFMYGCLYVWLFVIYCMYSTSTIYACPEFMLYV